MKRLCSTLCLGSLVAITATSLIAQTPPAPPAPPSQPAPRVASTGGRSPHETTSIVIGDRRTGPRITVTYGRPFTNDPKTGEARKIWGGLVPWEKPNRLGSDEATLLLTQAPLLIGDVTIPAGAYTLYLVPSESGVSKLAFSANIGKWGVPVDESKDLARVDLVKTTVEKPVDQLTINIEANADGTGGTLKITWETTQFSLPFLIKK